MQFFQIDSKTWKLSQIKGKLEDPFLLQWPFSAPQWHLDCVCVGKDFMEFQGGNIWGGDLGPQGGDLGPQGGDFVPQRDALEPIGGDLGP